MFLKLVISYFLLLPHLLGSAQSNKGTTLDPTGLYKLVNKTKIKNGDTYGYFGDIKVKQLSPDSIAINFYVCKGAPSYNSGSFTDTLTYVGNESVYRSAEDASCSITFHFTEAGVTVTEKTADYNAGCGFGHAVIADGYYKKTAAKILEIKSGSEE